MIICLNSETQTILDGLKKLKEESASNEDIDEFLQIIQVSNVSTFPSYTLETWLVMDYSFYVACLFISQFVQLFIHPCFHLSDC